MNMIDIFIFYKVMEKDQFLFCFNTANNFKNFQWYLLSFKLYKHIKQ